MLNKQAWTRLSISVEPWWLKSWPEQQSCNSVVPHYVEFFYFSICKPSEYENVLKRSFAFETAKLPSSSNTFWLLFKTNEILHQFLDMHSFTLIVCLSDSRAQTGRQSVLFMWSVRMTWSHDLTESTSYNISNECVSSSRTGWTVILQKETILHYFYLCR